MSRIKVPTDVATSPHDDSALTLDVDTQTFSDRHGNVWTVSDLAASRPKQHIMRWFRENYPKGA